MLLRVVALLSMIAVAVSANYIRGPFNLEDEIRRRLGKDKAKKPKKEKEPGGGGSGGGGDEGTSDAETICNDIIANFPTLDYETCLSTILIVDEDQKTPCQFDQQFVLDKANSDPNFVLNCLNSTDCTPAGASERVPCKYHSSQTVCNNGCGKKDTSSCSGAPAICDNDE